MTKKFLILLFIAAFIACGKNEKSQRQTPQPSTMQQELMPTRAPGKFVSVFNDKFLDAQGRHLLLHGINLVNKNKKVNYLGDEGADTFADMKKWGLNCIRLGIIWDGLEPKPGVYDESYLKGIDQRIAWAKENGLYVILDMHQDLFSVRFADGAPEWATLTNDQPHIHNSPVWSDAYFTSPAVQKAFDNFWNNAPAPDGIGIQEHYARAWAHVAKRYADEPTVIGYDLMNEPFVGSPAPKIQAVMFRKGAEILKAKGVLGSLTAADLAAQWMTPKGRSWLMQQLEDIDVYKQVIDATAPYYIKFERTILSRMYQRVARAIRSVDPNHILFLETTIASNMGVYSGLRPVRLRGKRDPLQAYAPHGYDLVTDTKDVAAANPERIRLIFTRHGETAKKLNMPMLVGEWGAYGFAASALPAARVVVREFEKLLCGDTYWTFEKGIEKTNHFRAIQRPYPQAVCGVLQSYHFDTEKNIFSCEWLESPQNQTETIIYLPDWCAPYIQSIRLTPEGRGYHTEELLSPENVILKIPPSGTGGKRKLEIVLRESKE